MQPHLNCNANRLTYKPRGVGELVEVKEVKVVAVRGET